MECGQKNEILRGSILTLIGGVFWGLSGVFGKYLFEYKGMTASWLVTVRLLISGAVLLTYVFQKQGKEIFKVWKKKAEVQRLLFYGLTGMALVQLSYYRTVELSNAGTATVLQYTAPVMIMVVLAIGNRKIPEKIEIMALIMALLGTFLLATRGHLSSLAISKETLVLGLLSAAAMVLYNLLPIQLIHKYNTFLIVGWGMLIGGVFLSVFVRPWEKNKIIWDGMTITGLFVIIMFGTILAFVAYMEGVRLIGASKASLYAAVEPLTATVASVIFFHVAFLPIDFTGFLCIIAAVAMLSIPKNKK